MAENNAKNYEGGTKGLGSVKTDVVSPALQKLTELSVKLRALTDNILEIKAKKAREEEERRAEEERRKEAEELLRIQKEEAEKKKAEEEATAKAKEEEKPEVVPEKPVEEKEEVAAPAAPQAPLKKPEAAKTEQKPVVQTRIFTQDDRKPRQDRPQGQNRPQGAGFNNNNRPQGQNNARPQQQTGGFQKPRTGATPPPPPANANNKGFKGNAAPQKKAGSPQDDKKAQNKKSLIRRGFIVEDNLGNIDEEGESTQSGRYLKKRPKKNGFNITETTTIDKAVITTEFISIKQLSEKIGKTGSEILKQLMLLGIMKTINDVIDFDTADLVAGELGVTLSYEPEKTAEDKLEDIRDEENDTDADKVSRPPIITIMGHVDHGKTSLLDYIRKSSVASGEAGGITQHIGAYTVSLNGRNITFLDTPGHEAFTSMRLRGALVTDIAVIVVAADDGIMPQTIEAINHAKAAGVDIIVAINKMDKPHANPDKIKEELAAMNFLVEEWGGKYQSQDISAKKGTGVHDLLEKVLLEAEMLDLKANPDRKATGSIIESSLDKGRGYVATMLVANGTLKMGDIVLAGTSYGKVKAMFNERNQRIKEAGPSEPVLILGLNGAPAAGDTFHVIDTEQEARDIANKREQLQREQGLRTQKLLTLDEVGRRLALGDFHELNVIVKGDVDGSVEALSDSLIKLSTEQVQVNVIHKGVGQISESDVTLAAASDAIIVGFQVRPSSSAGKLAEQEGVDIRKYSVIYDAIEEVKAAMEGMLAPTLKEQITATIEVREVFNITKVGLVAGAMVKTGKVKRSDKARLIRDGIVVFTGAINALKRFKDDVKEVGTNFECGISLTNCNDIKVGDIIEAYEEVEVKQTL